MKYWTKVLLCGSVTFIVITAITMFIAHSISNSSNVLRETEGGPVESSEPKMTEQER